VEPAAPVEAVEHAVRHVLPLGQVIATHAQSAGRDPPLAGLSQVVDRAQRTTGVPTHQAVEQLASIRAIPDLIVLRPADANETVLAWQVALELDGPSALLLSRQGLPILPKNDDVRRGAYIVKDSDKPEVLLLASGSEVGLALESAEALAREGVAARVVSMPSWELFDQQDAAYRDEVLPTALPKVIIEAGVAQGWERYGGAQAAYVTIERFGLSAPAGEIFEKFGFTVENVVAKAKGLIGK